MRINDPVMPIRVKLSTPVIDERVVPNPPGEPTDLLSTVGINGTVYDVGEQSDWNEADNTSKAYIKNKPAIPAAQVQTDWNQNNTFAVDFIKNKPTKLSDFSNDEGFITNAVNSLLNYYLKSETYTQAEVNALIGAISTITIELVESLPTTDIQTNVIYLTPKNPAEPDNIYDEYINIDGTSEGWEKIGDTEIDLSNYYTKSETDTLLSSKVDKVAGKGLSENDYTNTDKALVGTITDKLDKTENAIRSNALAIISPLTDTTPYVYRESPKGSFKALMKKIVGASVVWNQLVQNGNFADGTNCWTGSSGATFSVTNKVLSVDGNTSTYISTNIDSTHRPNSVSGHKYLISLNVKCSTNKVYVIPSGVASEGRFSPTNILSDTRCNFIWNCSVNKPIYYTLRYLATTEGTAENIQAEVHDLIAIDLTAMFGSTIADYVNTLETQTTGSGIAWLQSNGFFTEDYYAYKQNTLESGCVSAHKTYEGATVLTNTELSPITLRGKLGLDNGELTVDGDIYNSDGSVTRNYEERAYQSGDESLTDAITDGTNTIVKLATPTTEQTTPFTETEIVGSTEEFIDYEVAQNTRDVAIPVGTDTDYYQEMKLPSLPTTSGNHNLIYNPSTGFGWS